MKLLAKFQESCEEQKFIVEYCDVAQHSYMATRDSEFIKGLRVSDGDKFRCPSCKDTYDQPPHGSVWVCGCDMIYSLNGLMLGIGKDTEASENNPKVTLLLIEG